MYIFEIIKPGTWLVSDDRDWSWEIEGILRSLEGQFYEANLALNMFLHAISRDREDMSRERWEADSNRRSAIRKELESQLENPYDHQNWDELHLQTEIRFKREQWQSGRLPREFQHNQAFMHARAFLYALDSFDKFLNVLKLQAQVPQIVAELHDQFGSAFPQLRGVRNSAQHMEDRSRGLGAGKNPKPLELKPIENGMISAPGGALVLNCLNGSRYGNTMADGHYGEVDVSPNSMESLTSIFQSLLNAFAWKGPKSHLPSI
ncbi:hypothetical protein [Aeromonas caviae]|uniref:hypothetical protein n=1 Tax=Aeromonas caviae TaxID=648 RepID=UPI002B49B097|nr:hypothetical protein [Aeromonas caviae]